MARYSFTTNHHHRPVLDGWDLTPAERETFDYVDWDAVADGRDSRSFVRYAGELHDLGDVMRAPEPLQRLGWDGFNSDSFFSGIAYRYVDDGEAVVVARVYIESE